MPPASGASTFPPRWRVCASGTRQCEAAVIGPAGERGVLFASIVNNRGRSIGRGGLGAVMGAKNLKASSSSPGTATSVRPSPTPSASSSSSYEAEKVSRPTRSPRRRCPSSAPRCWSTCSTRPGPSPRATSARPSSSWPNRSPARCCKRDHVQKRAACRGCVIGCARRTTAGGESGEGPGVREHLGARRRLRRRRPHRHRAGQLRLQPGGHGHHHHGLHDRLRDGAQRGGPAARRTALRRRRGPAPLSPRRPPPASAWAPSSARAPRASPPGYGRPDLSMSVKRMELPAYDPRGMKAQGLAFATCEPRRLPSARQHARPRDPRRAQDGRPFRDPRQVGAAHQHAEPQRCARLAARLQVHRLRHEGGLLRAPASAP